MVSLTLERNVADDDSKKKYAILDLYQWYSCNKI